MRNTEFYEHQKQFFSLESPFLLPNSAHLPRAEETGPLAKCKLCTQMRTASSSVSGCPPAPGTGVEGALEAGWPGLGSPCANNFLGDLRKIIQPLWAFLSAPIKWWPQKHFYYSEAAKGGP